MDQDKLRALREKYGSAPEGTIFDPEFAEVGKQIFRGGRRLWPFAGVSTFLDAPYRPAKGDDPDLAGLALQRRKPFTLQTKLRLTNTPKL